MTKDTTKAAAVAADIMLFDNWFDPIEVGVRTGVRGFIETMLEVELTAVLSRPRYVRRKVSGNEESTASPLIGCRHGHRKRTLTGTFGKTEIAVPRARLKGEDGEMREWKSKSLRAYRRRARDRRRLDRRRLSCRNQHASRAPRSQGGVRRGSRQGCREPATWRKVKGDWDGRGSKMACFG
jgi:putative transposase